MQAGQKLNTPDGKQVMLYPLTIVQLNQLSGPNEFSHCCGHAVDASGPTNSKDTLYAPCNCHKIYQGEYTKGNTCTFVSDEEVFTPKGLSYVTFQFTHGDLLGNGETYKQGEPIYTTGVLGFAYGDHVHMDQSLVKDDAFVSSGVTCKGGNLCYQLAHSTDITNVYFVNDTNIQNSLGLKFKTYEGGYEPVPPAKENKFWMYMKPIWKRIY